MSHLSIGSGAILLRGHLCAETQLLREEMSSVLFAGSDFSAAEAAAVEERRPQELGWIEGGEDSWSANDSTLKGRSIVCRATKKDGQKRQELEMCWSVKTTKYLNDCLDSASTHSKFWPTSLESGKLTDWTMGLHSQK